MSTALSRTDAPPPMSREAFLDWAEAQDIRYEFDGFQPVAMVGGTINHNRIGRNILIALDARLRGKPCEALGPDAGIATIGNGVRYPDALVTCTRTAGTARIVAGPVVVFEVLGPHPGRTDRIDKLRDYAANESIRRYVILEYASAAATVFSRAAASDAWTAVALTQDDTVHLTEIGIEIPLAAFYDNVDFDGAAA
jgi:Uma2 family endonuclease